MKTISFLILILFSAQTSLAQSGNFDFSIGISPTLGCKADYRYEPSSGGGFNFARNNYSECLSNATSSSSTSLNLGEAIAYQFFSDQKIQDAVISITNTTQDIILKNIGAVQSRDDQISQTNQTMDSTLNKIRTSFDREIRHAQEHSKKWEQVNQQFDRDVIQHLEDYRQNITHQIKEVEAKRSRLHDLADNDFSTSDSHSTNFSQYLSSSKLQSKLKKELGDRNSHSGLSLARGIYHEDPDFQRPRFVKLEQEFEKTKQADLLDQEAKTLFDAAKQFYDSKTQRQHADKIVDHLSARRIQKTTDGIQDLDQYISHDLASRVISFEQKKTKARAQIKLTRQLIKNGHDFGHPLDVIKRLVNHSEMATSAASEIFYDKFMEQGELLVEMAVGSLDIASNFIPIVSPARDFYELTTGRNLFTNEKLSENERIIVGASFLTLGLGSSVKELAKMTYNISQSLGGGITRGIIRTSERIIASARKSGLFLGRKFEDLKGNSSYETVKELFRELDGPVPLNKKKKLVKSFKLKKITHQVLDKDLEVYRWHNNNSDARKFGRFVSTDKIIDPKKARKLLALPESNEMLHFDKYIIKRGTKIFKGPVAPLNGHPGGGNQVFITGKLEDSLVPLKD